VAVPEKRHPFRKWRRRGQHVIDPPLLKLGDRKTTAGRVRGQEQGRLRRLGFDQAIDGLAESV